MRFKDLEQGAVFKYKKDSPMVWFKRGKYFAISLNDEKTPYSSVIFDIDASPTKKVYPAAKEEVDNILIYWRGNENK